MYSYKFGDGNGNAVQLGPFNSEQELKAAYVQYLSSNNKNPSAMQPMGGTAPSLTDDEKRIIGSYSLGKLTPEEVRIAESLGLTGAQQKLNPDYLPVDQRPNSGLAPSPYTGMTTSNTGAPVPMGYNQQTSSPSGNPTYPQQTSPTPPVQQPNDAQLQQLLNDPNLTADQKAAIQAIYNAVSANDQAKAEQIKAGIAAATQYSDPYFKAQTRLVLDSLDRAFGSIDGDLSYKQTSLQNSLQSLQRDMADAKDYLSFQELQDMKALERNYQQQLDSTVEDMAARGFSSSSVRAKKETLLGDTYSDLRESTSRSFSERNNQLTNQLGDAQRNAALEIQRLQQVAQQNKTDALRQAEQQAGTTALNQAGYNNTLGGIGGEIPRAQATDALSFASNFVF